MKTPYVAYTPEVNIEIIKSLKELGVPSSLKGYEYLKTGLRLILECPTVINQVTKALYPTIAIIHSTTGPRVERSIRHAIETTLNSASPLLVQETLGTLDCRNGKITNSEFMSRVAENLRIKMRVYDSESPGEVKAISELRERLNLCL